jgi:hypothetical protein
MGKANGIMAKNRKMRYFYCWSNCSITDAEPLPYSRGVLGMRGSLGHWWCIKLDNTLSVSRPVSPVSFGGNLLADFFPFPLPLVPPAVSSRSYLL